MKDKNGIEIECKNCRNTIFGSKCYFCKSYDKFLPTDESYEARIAELQKELTVIQESERAEAQEADRLRAEIKEAKQIKESSESFYQKYSGVSEEYALGALEQCATEADELQEKVNVLEKKLTETVKLLGERSRECGELEAHNEVLQRRIKEFSMELLDRTMRDNKDVLERLKQAES
jgi:uncharacterized coiled-coil DUF342 family protein